MEKSASEPVLRSEDYHLPCHGVGDTGHAKRVLLSFTAKDTGKNSSRINQIIKQAEKCPGPGKYVAHSDWKLTHTHKFANSSREYKPMHKGPSAVHYEVKEFATKHSIGAEDNTSNHPRMLYGKVLGGKKRSFLDGAVKHGQSVPGPGAHNPTAGCSDRLRSQASKMVSWDKEKSKTKSMKVKVPEIAPNHYKLEYAKTEPSLPNYSVPKEVGKNFIDRYVKEKWTDARSKKEIPGPGTYNMQNFDDSKTSRGTYHLQLRGMTRNPASGYF